MAISVMQRFELKYLLDGSQTDRLPEQLEGYMEADAFGLTSISSLYYDTPDARLIRASLEKPIFKEKLRLRSYGLATKDSPVYLELKRKYDGVVYKRRVQTTVPRAERFFAGEEVTGDGQIGRELAYFRDHYPGLRPACLIVYDRTAYFQPGGDLRLTIDRRPRYRTEDLDLTSALEGIPLLEEGRSILEIKVQGAMPLWLSGILSREGIFKSSFSKYGEAWKRELAKKNETTIVFPAPHWLGAA